VEKGATVDGVTGFEVARGSRRGDLGWELVPVDVHAGADDDGVAVAFGEDPRQLAVADDEVVGPLQAGREPRDPRHGLPPPRAAPAAGPPPHAIDTAGARPGPRAGRSSPAARSDAPGGATHPRPRRPRPAVWKSATATRPSGAPRRASSST